MRFLIAIILSGFSSLSFACTDFNGTYRDLNTSSEVQIIQTACLLVTTISEGATVAMTIDNQYHTLSDTVSYRGSFPADKLLLEFNIHLDSEGAATDQESKLLLSLDENNNLVTVATQPDGTVDTLLQTRIK